MISSTRKVRPGRKSGDTPSRVDLVVVGGGADGRTGGREMISSTRKVRPGRKSGDTPSRVDLVVVGGGQTDGQEVGR